MTQYPAAFRQAAQRLENKGNHIGMLFPSCMHMSSHSRSQNVALQLGLVLVSNMGKAIKSLRHHVLRCDGCFQSALCPPSHI